MAVRMWETWSWPVRQWDVFHIYTVYATWQIFIFLLIYTGWSFVIKCLMWSKVIIKLDIFLDAEE